MLNIFIPLLIKLFTTKFRYNIILLLLSGINDMVLLLFEPIYFNISLYVDVFGLTGNDGLIVKPNFSNLSE